MSMLAFVSFVAFATLTIPQHSGSLSSLRGKVRVEGTSHGLVHVELRRLRERAEGTSEDFDPRTLHARRADASILAGPDGAFAIDTAAGSYAVFAFVDVNGDGTWTPAVPEPCGWLLRVDVPHRDAEDLQLTLRAPMPLPKADRVLANGALRWQRGYPIVQLHGDPAERGHAHGELLAAQIVDFFRFYVLQDRLGSANAYREFAAFLDRAFVWPEPFLREIDGVLAGMHDSGANLKLAELGRDFGRTELLAINAYIETRAMRSSCTQFVCWGERTAGTDVGGGTIAGRNMDGECDLRRVTVSHFVMFAVTPSEPGQKRYVSMMWPGFVGTLSGFNEAGVHC
ncbi:MAG: hypothetical protein ABIP94_21960, partial [Planctomycetota bacterium]